MIDLDPPARQLKTLLHGIADEQLSAATPCESYTVADLLDHLVGLTMEFRDAATKSTRSRDGATEGPAQGPGKPSAANLPPDWRSLLPLQLDDLVTAWRDPAAWEGSTQAGGVTLPADVMGMVVLDELVLHGWDLARATGQAFECDPVSTQVCFEFTSMASVPGREAAREGLFGPVVDVPSNAPLLHRALGLSGRDPSWKPRGAACREPRTA
ncbi:MAG: TIGR03086 family metal-binding protein [Actinomycetota bacterium]|nr:TIGR03086 family metal-binding protein [Actinomycetota bacterium]